MSLPVAGLPAPATGLPAPGAGPGAAMPVASSAIMGDAPVRRARVASSVEEGRTSSAA
ncbi:MULTISPECIES: hypothetical protein [Streptomyces]|uniref:Uncharacterized protein n=1 Tax=Streptomyces rutgersensis TaxID=53451 RepID=A0ABX6RT87_9ACTN|nr:MULTISPECIES: hypothetical protein [Streptomyces]MBL3804424.1 hypothetical protein [Streptomyces sp. BRB081]QNE83204.1 hypothetical protein F0345_20515 [Streptomyces rutgersensis]RPK85907.1 hypothetical protein EES47_21835 [Streptomyces sp. ADI98-12]GFH67614.1 hypothetical protein Srut_41280 [Streptomyces rutgersensis]